MIIKIPINLKYDSDDESFDDFVHSKVEDRSINDLIINLLHVYYEKEEIRKLVKEYNGKEE